MSNEENNTIEDYLDGNMSDKESKGFEKAMEKNAQLAKEVAIVKEVNQTISQEAKLKAFKKQLSHLSDSYFQLEEDKHAPNGVVTINSPKRNNRRRWLVAATILILAISSVFIWNLLNNPADSTALFAANYEPYGLGQRSSGTNNNALEQQAIEAYNNNSFAEAIPLLEQLIDANPSNEKNILRLGSAYLSNNQSQKAINIFQKIINNSQSTLIQAAQWYQALAYLQLDNTDEAKKVLTTLANAGNRTYPTKAQQLLNALN